MDYIELDLTISPKEPWTEIAIVRLSENGFDGFLESETGVLAYIPVLSFLENEVVDILQFPEDVHVDFSYKTIEHQNWNALWEEGFEPVLVEDKLVILAPFHSDEAYKDRLNVVIQPQMSFGTGHHQTTYMMCNFLLQHPSKFKKVLDVGTGTGVLALLAEKLGAEYCLGTEIESWSVVNARENAVRNNCSKVEIIEGDIDCVVEKEFDLILANINKNVLKGHLSEYAKLLKKKGDLVLSGFFETDKDELVKVASEFDFVLNKYSTKETWCSLEFIKQ